ncbi:amidohydrolase [Chelonobacter oris]|uniref:Amidohydrolase n=1 Tax=Chelonobacter oris TaxID=505317 RepID=A0A0A3AT06_9PAST|nr:amidohydrolase family protein [Chelonobacter oris]KGQ70165.1 amidohydrolase [Chelonobacter oris]
MKIIAVEEHIQSPALAKVMMPAMLAQAPFLLDWGKDVADSITDPSRPQVIAAGDSLKKLADVGEGRLREMDEYGIDMQMLSYAGLPQLVEGAAGVQAIRAANDYLSEKMRSNPSRFGGFAYLPWQDVNAAVSELERVHKLGFKGVLINGRPSEKWLDNVEYEAVLAKLDALEMPLFLHPGLPFEQVQQAYYAGFKREVSARLSMFAWGWHNEAGIQLIRMILGGVFDKFPQLNVIMGHWGELVPYYLQRLDDSIPQQATGLKRTITETFKAQVYVTPSGMMSNPHFVFNRAIVGADRILFSVDYPYLSMNGARQWLENLDIAQEDKEKIAYKNAERLFKL